MCFAGHVLKRMKYFVSTQDAGLEGTWDVWAKLAFNYVSETKNEEQMLIGNRFLLDSYHT